MGYFNSVTGNQNSALRYTAPEINSDFVSFRDVYLTAIDELEEIETIKEHDMFLEKYEHILTLTDSSYVPKIENPIYQIICNPEGIYLSEGFAHKIIDKQSILITKVDNIRELVSANSVSNLDPKKFKLLAYNMMGANSSNTRLMANCGNQPQAQYERSERGCKKDRKVVVRGSSTVIYSGYYNFKPSVLFEAYGEKKNTFCKWKLYETTVETKASSFEVTLNINGDDIAYSEFFNAKTESNSKGIILHQGTLNVFPVYWSGGTAYPSATFTKANLQGSSRGIDNNWAVLNCQ